MPPDAKSRLIGKDPDAGKDEGRRRGQKKVRWLDGIIKLNGYMSLSKLWETVKGKSGVQQSMGVTKSQTQLSN